MDCNKYVKFLVLDGRYVLCVGCCSEQNITALQAHAGQQLRTGSTKMRKVMDGDRMV